MSGALKGKKVLITAGPTVEPIDPVRFISNHSSGRMGIALAEAAAAEGAAVTLVMGPTNLATNVPGVTTVPVTTAQDMYEAATEAFPNCHLAIMAAAVADYTPVTTADKKIKKADDEMVIRLKKTKDILKTLGERKQAGQLLVGFALETDNELNNARKKLKEKNADLIVLNSPGEDSGFGHATNRITLVGPAEKLVKFDLKPKSEVARDIMAAIVTLL